ncbi:MAG: tetratricopeptide repeat protein [Polyangiaceae bacterium]|nr:tetratricopeptide repeat protein [Polyangiaceae bacterium]
MSDLIAELKARLEDDPCDEGALERLVAAACAEGDWSLAREALTQWSEVTSDEHTIVRLLLRSAKIAEERLGDLDAAEDAYRQVLELNPSAEDAARAVVRIRQLRGG